MPTHFLSGRAVDFYGNNIGGQSHLLSGGAIVFDEINISERSHFLHGGAIAFLEWRGDFPLGRLCQRFF
ncbi:MAG: hypothetical protein F6K35_46620 [Okeania sp. SIO2H7]|nr:hypothetical protein [Okeania sp. SIO2H7]